jgi:chromate reductase, NAD(P)H dehydrogenase (quinone)
MTDRVRVLGISGSLRQASFNTALLRTAIDLAPPGIEIEVVGIDDLPFYDEDVRSKGYPDVVQKFRERIAKSDGLVIATPEYNYSVPAVLKNAIDWASRPPQQPFGGKPLGILGASSGLGGTVRAQAHLRQIAASLDLHVMNKPEVFVRSAGDKVGEGRITDEPTRKVIGDFMVAYEKWVRLLTPG